MKIKELIIKLKEVAELNPNGRVFLNGTNCDYVDFTGFSVDDLNDIQLYEISGDMPA